MKGQIRDFSKLRPLQPVWITNADMLAMERADKALHATQQEHIQECAKAIGCRITTTKRNIEGTEVWFLAFVKDEPTTPSIN